MTIRNISAVFKSDVRTINLKAQEASYIQVLDDLLPFEQEGIQTTTVTLQKSYQGLTIVEDRPRNSGGVLRKQGDGKMVTFRANHFPIEGDVNAPSYQDVIDVYTGELLSSMDAEIERRFSDDIISFRARETQMKFGLIKGLMVDHNGNVVGDLYSDFDYQRHPTVTIDLTTTVDNIDKQLRDISVTIQKNTFGRAMTQKPLLLVDVTTFSDILSVLRSVEQYTSIKTLKLTQSEVITDFSIDIAGVYATYNEQPLIEAAKGYVVPRGVPGFYMHKYAPPVLNSMDYVNRIASQPYYALRVPNKTNSGVTLYTESNPLFLIGDPRMLVQVDFTLP